MSKVSVNLKDDSCHQILCMFFSGDLPLASCCIHSNEALAWRELTYQCHLQHVLPSLATESTDLEDLEVTAVVTGYSRLQHWTEHATARTEDCESPRPQPVPTGFKSQNDIKKRLKDVGKRLRKQSKHFFKQFKKSIFWHIFWACGTSNLLIVTLHAWNASSASNATEELPGQCVLRQLSRGSNWRWSVGIWGWPRPLYAVMPLLSRLKRLKRLKTCWFGSTYLKSIQYSKSEWIIEIPIYQQVEQGLECGNWLQYL